MTKPAPRIISNRLIVMTFLIAVSLPLTVAADGPIREAVQVIQVPAVYITMKGLTWIGKGWVLLVLAAGLLAWGIWRKQPAPKTAGTMGIAALVISGIAGQIIKHLIGRPRPRLLDSGAFHLGPSLESGYDSFPSGHAISAFAMAVVLSSVYPKWRGLWYGAAVLVALTRVYTDAHFASDTVGGAFLGIVVAKAALHYRQWYQAS